MLVSPYNNTISPNAIIQEFSSEDPAVIHLHEKCIASYQGSFSRRKEHGYKAKKPKGTSGSGRGVCVYTIICIHLWTQGVKSGFLK